MPKLIQAAVVPEPGADFETLDVLLDDPRAGEVLVRVEAVGICHADIAAREGKTPFPHPAVLGHEGAGVVETVGAGVTSLRPGDRVVLTFASCGACASCRSGLPSQCVDFLSLNFAAGARPDGSPTLWHGDTPLHGHFFGQSSFATHALVTERNAVKLPDDAPLATLAPLGCGIQTGAGAVLNVLRPAPGGSVAVFGAGAVGLAAVMEARLAQAAQVIAVDVNPGRLALATELGATDTIDARTADPVAAIRKLTGGGAGHVLESSGNVLVFRQAIDAAAIGGVIGIVGAPFGREAAVDVADIVNASKRIVGIVEGGGVPHVFIPTLAALHAAGRLPVERLVTTFPFDRINDAARAAALGEAVKPVLLL
ncbi:NAD(P)-dependent alcohol dehydrogenase [Streptomyces sp. F001]|uniref:NAD(P)-dependent alcohol dehydrogenase n=1 Tax=Streptomyces sp. F001 TaxID=1510026 RepID=UPI00101E4D90|nr:NAD(P)-dependent alcohol dehydrogenase [Streptomyces sp. F001]RZB19329.1 NAD(P)-dependent alcohol dehydrogenase [Streptomyces sp. F001]